MTPAAILNLTPHTLRVVDAHGVELLVLPPAANPARLAQIVEAETIDLSGVPWRQIDYGEPIDLPAPEPRTALVVSRPIAETSSARRPGLPRRRGTRY